MAQPERGDLSVEPGTDPAEVLRAGASRYPYDRVRDMVLREEHDGTPAYAVWFYGEGETVNFYCAGSCVREMPRRDDALPARLVLLYRPRSRGELVVYRRLLQEGYVDERHAYFTDGQRTDFGTMVATLERPRR